MCFLVFLNLTEEQEIIKVGFKVIFGFLLKVLKKLALFSLDESEII